MNDKILIRDIPVVITLGDLCKNVSMAYKIMVAVIEGKALDVNSIAKEILSNNDALIEANIDTEALKELLEITSKKRKI